MTENITEMYGIKCSHIVMVLGKIYKLSGFGEANIRQRQKYLFNSFHSKLHICTVRYKFVKTY